MMSFLLYTWQLKQRRRWNCFLAFDDENDDDDNDDRDNYHYRHDEDNIGDNYHYRHDEDNSGGSGCKKTKFFRGVTLRIRYKNK